MLIKLLSESGKIDEFIYLPDSEELTVGSKDWLVMYKDMCDMLEMGGYCEEYCCEVEMEKLRYENIIYKTNAERYDMKTIVGDYTIGNYAHECYREGSKKWLKMMESCDSYYDNKCSKYCSVEDINGCPLVNYIYQVRDGMI